MDKLVRSQIWPDGMKYFVDKDFRQLTFFDVKELIFINSNPKKLAIEFSKDDRYNDISWVYLMLKSFKDDSYPIDTILYAEFEVNVLYPTKKVQEWVGYNCGNGLWYIFDHKYSMYKDQIKLNEMYIGDKTSIENDCISIDKERYKNMNFGPSLLSKLGDQLESDILELLYCCKSTYYIKIPQASAYFQNIVIFFKIVHSQPVRCNPVAFYSSYTIGPPMRLNTNTLPSKFCVTKLLFICQWVLFAFLGWQIGLPTFVVPSEPLVARVQAYVEVFEPVLLSRKVLFQHPVIVRLPDVAIT